jgi:tetratricopeptide (TPR) repeat protein
MPLFGQPLGRSLTKYELDDYQSAVDDSTKAIELDSKYAYAYDERGRQKLKLKDYAGALADYNEAVKLDPKDPSAFYNRSRAKSALKDFAGAITDCSTAIQENPQHALYYTERGFFKTELKDYNGAITDNDKAIEIDPNYAAAYNSRGYLQYDLGQWQPALESFRKGLELDPTKDYSRFRVWLIRTRLGEETVATKELSQHLDSLSDNDAKTWPANIGQFLVGRLNETDFLLAAANTAKDADEKNGQLCEANFYIATKHLLAGDKATAAEFFQKSIDTGKDTFYEYGSAQAELAALEGNGSAAK